jgi:Fe(3+) dicitrate transport protein
MTTFRKKMIPLFLLFMVVSLIVFPTANITHAQSESEAIKAPAVEIIGVPETLERIPGSGQIIDPKTLENTRPFTINEALRKAPGVHTRDEEGFGLRPNIGIRGLNPTRSTKLTLLEDGVPLAYAPYGDNASYYHPPIDRFERIEILKGAGQILFGPQTIGGVINYITPYPPATPGGFLKLMPGNRDYFNGHINYGGTWGDNGLLLDYLRKQGDGARDNVNSILNDLNFKAVLQMGSRQALTLRGNYYTENSDITYSGITQAEFNNFGIRYNPFKNDEFEVDRYGASATHEVEVGKNSTLTTNLYGAIFQRHWWRQSSTTTDTQCGNAFRDARLAGTAVDPDACNSIQGRLREYYTWGIEPRFAMKHAVFGLPSELDTGFRLHYESQYRKQLNGTSPTARTGTIVEDNNRFTDAYSVFLQNRFLLQQWSVTPGVRMEHIRSERTNLLNNITGKDDLTAWLPSLGTTYKPVQGTTLFAGIHRGFAPPRTEDLIGTTGTSTDVDAEESWNYELGVRSTPAQGIHAEATLFRNDFENLIAVGSIAGGATPLAQAEAVFQGLEVLSQIDAGKLMEMKANPYFQLAYTYLPTAKQETAFIQVANQQPVTGSEGGKRMPYAPMHQLTATLGYEHPSGWDARLESVYVGGQFADFANTEIASSDGQRGKISAYNIWNIAVNYNIAPIKTTLFLTAKNVFDRTYIVDRTRGILPGSPRLIQGGLKYIF